MIVRPRWWPKGNTGSSSKIWLSIGVFRLVENKSCEFLGSSFGSKKSLDWIFSWSRDKILIWSEISSALLVALSWVISGWTESLRCYQSLPKHWLHRSMNRRQSCTFFGHGDGKLEDGHRDRQRIVRDLPHSRAPAVGVLLSVYLGIPSGREMIVGNRRDQKHDNASNTKVRQVRAVDVV